MLNFLLFIAPLKLISKITGKLAGAKLPRFLLRAVIHFLIKVFKVDMADSRLKMNDFTTINEFFTRTLKEGARTVDPDKKSVVSSVDGTLLNAGEITDGKLMQAKGEGSSLDELIDIPGFRKRFVGGNYVTIYLSPKDYHRIHSPLSGTIRGYSYIPGKLYPVNSYGVNNIKRLFSKNERLITYIETEKAMCAVVKVGASNVGSIKVNYKEEVQTNARKPAASEVFMNGQLIEKGEELGRFEFGSTVILLFEKGMVRLNSLTLYHKVQYGEVIGTLLKDD